MSELIKEEILNEENRIPENGEQRPKKEQKLHKLGKNTWVDYIIIAFLIIFAFCAFYPMWYVIAGSFSNGNDYMRGGVYFWPRMFTFANYSVVFYDDRVWLATLVTVVRCMVGPTLNVFLTSLVAYGMSRRELYFKKFFNGMFLFTMFFSGGTIPYYLLCKILGLLNTFWMYVIPGMLNVYNMILIRSFFNGSPEELHEAAVMDGASEFRIYFTIAIPLCMPILMTIFMWGLIGHWSDYITSMYYVPTNTKLHTLQYVLMKIIQAGDITISDVPGLSKGETTGETISYAAMVFGTIPMLIAYPFLQKYFTKGLVLGSVKG